MRAEGAELAGSICIGEHYLGPEIAAVIRSRGVAAKQGFLMYYSKGDAIGTRVSVRYRRSGRLSEVVVKRGSTVHACYASYCTLYSPCLRYVIVRTHLVGFTRFSARTNGRDARAEGECIR